MSRTTSVNNEATSSRSLVQIRRIRRHRCRIGTDRGSLGGSRLEEGSQMSAQQRVSFFRSHLTWAVTAFVGYTSVMLTLERQMQRCGGPGIIAFELAGRARQGPRDMNRGGGGGRGA